MSHYKNQNLNQMSFVNAYVKKHITTDGNGMALGVHMVAANKHDSRGLAGLIDKSLKAGIKKLWQTKLTKAEEMMKCRQQRQQEPNHAQRSIS